MSDTLQRPPGDALRPDAAFASVPDCRGWTGHVIVCGLQPVGIRSVEQLMAAGARVVVLEDEGASERHLRALRQLDVPILPRGTHLSDSLADAGIAGAEAVICIESSDLRTLETVLLVRNLRPDVRVVAELDNPAVAGAVQEVTGSATVADVASLFAPAVIEALTKRRAHDILIGSTRFVTVEVTAASTATLRKLYGSLVPLGVTRAGEPDPVVCPGRDHEVAQGDRVTLLGTRQEIEEGGFGARLSSVGEMQKTGTQLLTRLRAMAGQLTTSDKSLRIATEVSVLLVVVSTLILHFGYVQPAVAGPHGVLHPAGQLGLISALYFTVETIATVGFGDFSFASQPLGMEIFGIVLIVAGTTIISTIFALLTNALVSRRIAQSLGQAQIPGMRGHVVMVGLGAVGMAVLDGLLSRGREVVVVERDETNRYLNQVRQRGVPLVLGDSTLGQTLDSVNLSKASSVAIVTSDDMTNIETGLAVRDRLGPQWSDVPVVLRVFDRDLGRHLERSFDFRHVWSTVAIAAPWFAGAALGMEVLFSFYVGSYPFLLARLRVTEGGGLDGVQMRELSARMRVIAIGRDASTEGGVGSLEHPPRRETRLQAGDDAYLAGPYEELLQVLKRDRSTNASTGSTFEP